MFVNDIERQKTIGLLKKRLPEKVQEAGWLTYYELEGFLFGVCCASEPVEPSQWLPLVWDDEPPAGDELDKLFAAIFALYNHINQCVLDQNAFAARTAEPVFPAIRNFELDTPVEQWSWGFAQSQNWFIELIEMDLARLKERDKKLAEAYVIGNFTLTCFADRPLAESLEKEAGEEKTTLEEMADKTLSAMNDAMSMRATIGRSLYLENIDAEYGDDDVHDVGRNDPCPCGSGKKFKKCCGA